MFEMIFASSINGVIGNNNSIPWNVPEDLTHFRKITMDGIVVMGRKTFDSLPNGILKNRINIVITCNINKQNEDNLIFTDINNVMSVIEDIQKKTNKKVYIIGGSMIYKAFYKYCNVIHHTIIHINIDGDTKFPFDISFPDCINNYTSELLCSKNNNIMYQFFTYSKK
jgi:dihydrofolate reductase